MTEDQLGMALQLLPLVIATLAVFFGPIMQLKIAERQEEIARRYRRTDGHEQWAGTVREATVEVLVIT